jgi:regulator of protease activity HflC (stomatin/prohibitin superfamily)
MFTSQKQIKGKPKNLRVGKHKNKLMKTNLYFKVVGYLAVLVAVFGFIAPFLVSYPDNFLTFLGIGTIVGGVWFAIWGAIKLFNSFKSAFSATKLILLALVSLSLFSSCSRVDQGYVGIKVYLLGGDKGVDNEVLGVGRYWIGINEDLYLFPVYQVNYVYTADATEGSPANEEFTFQTKEGMECKMDLGVAMQFKQDKITKMFQTYRKGVEEIRAVVVRNAIRDALNISASSMSVESVYGEGKGDLIAKVQQMVKSQLDTTGIDVIKISLIGSIRIPASIKKALDEKVAMTQEAQKAENEVQRAIAKAEIAKANAEGEAASILIVAKAQADANRVLSASITQTLVNYKSVEKWNGILPTVSGSNTPFISLNK